jgi:16S rRNA (guanine527-N7)-methyltransferase
MTENGARAWIESRFGVSRETKLARFVDLVRTVADEQNLIARSTLPHIWQRHVLDSAQLLTFVADVPAGDWVDIGSGAGFPGLVIAILTDRPVVLVEPRKLRADFLRYAATSLELEKVEVLQAKVEQIERPAAIISARAVSRLDQLLKSAQRCALPSTIWLLPKGRSVQEELGEARRTWHGSFHVEQSLTSPDSAIVIAKGVKPR